MSYKISEINAQIASDPLAFVSGCEGAFQKQIEDAAGYIASRLDDSHVVLLSGPSGSAKTTTAYKLQHELKSRGIGTHTVSIDDYFLNFDQSTAPRTPEGELDLESPLCVDMELLNEHFTALNAGREIKVPHYVFRRQKRSVSEFRRLKLLDNEIAIFEGIHALNDEITAPHPEAVKLYISAASEFYSDNGDLLFQSAWLRLMRRAVRDSKFRGASANFTIGMWARVLRGEILYIDPYKHKADITIDSTLPYEVSVMKSIALPLFADMPDDNPRHEELAQILPALEQFAALKDELVPLDSILREFIGGSVYYGDGN